MKTQVWTIVEVQKLNHKTNALERQARFYMGDITGIDIETKSDLSTLHNKKGEVSRKSTFLGLKTNITFPIEFPLTLDCGKVIESGYFVASKEELEDNLIE